METSKHSYVVVGAIAISITCCSRRSAWPSPRPNLSLSRKPREMLTLYRLLCRAAKLFSISAVLGLGILNKPCFDGVHHKSLLIPSRRYHHITLPLDFGGCLRAYE